VFLLERGEPCTLLPCLLVFPRSWKECEERKKESEEGGLYTPFSPRDIA
jgi:hypothetical protein